MNPVLAAWLGGVACYAGVLLTPRPAPVPRLPAWYVACLSLGWPFAIVLAFAEWERRP